jgi:hypothetical protein
MGRSLYLTGNSHLAGYKTKVFLAVILALILANTAHGLSIGYSRVVQASEVLAKIENQTPVEYNNVIIEGELDLSKLNLLTKPAEISAFDILALGTL